MERVVLITGASRGIGQAAAEIFAQAGYRVAINYNQSEDKAAELSKRLKSMGFHASLFKADVSDINQVKAMVESCESAFGPIDVLINNAGIAQQKLFTEITAEDWSHMFSVNVTGVFNCCRCVLPSMIRRHSGKIINVSSIWGICGASCEVHYSAAKAAVIGLTKALAKEEGPSNIQINCIAPGIIDTEMNCNLSIEEKSVLCDQTPLGRFGTAHDIANTMLFLASPSADFITGQVISPNGGFVI